MVQSYSMSREGLRKLLWRSGRTSFAVTALLAAMALSLTLRNEDAISPGIAGSVAVYLAGVLIAGAWLSVRSTRRSWLSYRLELSERQLSRFQSRMPAIVLDRAEVIRIEEMPGRGLIVHTQNPERFVYIPRGIERYEDIRRELAGWAPLIAVSAATTWKRHWLGLTAALLIVFWMIATMISQTPAFVIPSAFVISVFLLWAFIAAQRSLHLDRRTKLSMWLVIFPILALTLKTTYLLSAP